ncbi:endopeptidase [Mycolicibacterium madagascariense]|uniref:Endopeptidase n=1 Tax=Mycolicibacterium madagascariense TaxID=212765 RepID=A0A7I7XI65_9MYCO|nr:Xaa-Pro peptidase family protein [Mycolicibacterium madagascariense]MCV7012776.1 aminopeptidase P family protein [Mycolicibacterium madagascariense]BBZ28889.1 endopeptidase [Mycolicibacterium madagascariense]
MVDRTIETRYNAARLAIQMDLRGVDVVVSTSLENVRYLTGINSVALEMFPHTGHCFAVVARDQPGAPFFISSRCEVDQFLDAPWPLAGALAYGPFSRESRDEPMTEDELRLRKVSVEDVSSATPLEALTQALKLLGVDSGRVAIDETGVNPAFLDAFAETRPRDSTRDAGPLLRAVRKVKTAGEQDAIAASAAVAEHGIAAAIGIARPGITERDLVREFERSVVSLGARPKFTLIKIGRAGVGGQTQPTDLPLKSGQAIWFDVGGVVDGYWYDVARVFCLGEPDAKVAAYYDAMLAGEQRAIEAARPGMTGRQLFDLTVEAVRECGVPHYQRHHVGHGIGVEVYDDVLITPSSDDVIEEGTVVNIETPYYEFGFGAVHVEDPFVVSASGNRLLTTMSRALETVGR